VQPVLTAGEMRAADAAALVTVSHETLVDRAGTAAGHAALRLLGGGYGRRVLVVVGKGSNGADGRVAAAFLARRGARVTLFDAAAAPAALPRCDLVIDAAYGTGFHGAYDAPTVPPGVSVLSVDIASGVDADTGAAPGTPFCATETVTFAAYKPGLLQGAGTGCSGDVHVVDIGVALPPSGAALIEDADVAAHVPPRPRQSHKWSTALGIASGSVGMEGSAILCTRGAMAAGAGMIRLGNPGNPSAAWPTEAVRVHLDGPRWAEDFLAAAEKCRAMVIGPGLGTDDTTQEEIRTVIARAPHPLVIDADAITALGDANAAAGRRPPGRGAGPGAADRRRRPAQGTAHRGGGAGRNARRPPGLGRGAGAGHRRDGRCALGRHRSLLGPRRAGTPGRGTRGPCPRPRRRPGPARGPGGRGPAGPHRGLAQRGRAPWLRRLKRTSSSCSEPA